MTAFIHADLETRVQRCVRYYGIDEATARSRIRQTDRQRASYYAYFSDKRWGSYDAYDLMLDCGRFGVDGCAELLVRAATLPRP